MLTRQALIAYVAALALVAVVTVVLPAQGMFPPRALGLAEQDLREGQVLEVVERSTRSTPGGDIVTERFAVQVDGGRVEVQRTTSASADPALAVAPGDEVLVLASPGPDGTTYGIRDRVRRVPVMQLAFIFGLLVVIVGGWHGAISLVGLGATVLVVGRFIVPAILAGRDPLLTCIAGALVIMAATLTLGHGPHRRTWIALASTAIALVLGGVFSAWAVDFARLTGLTEDSVTLQQLAGSLDVRGLLLGGIILGAVGVLDDVTTTQAATVFELREANPGLSPRELFSRGMNVGREHIAATTNTLLLAYAGSGLPLLVILAAQDLQPGILVSFDALATELVRTLAGSTAIVAAVPITTALAALDAGRDRDGTRRRGEPVASASPSPR
ncbi:MAG: YibE/F family protein [Dehalococcoidia bacterium]|nr:YibE/F family protein [Dehalococcoidia bacterium]